MHCVTSVVLTAYSYKQSNSIIYCRPIWVILGSALWAAPCIIYLLCLECIRLWEGKVSPIRSSVNSWLCLGCLVLIVLCPLLLKLLERSHTQLLLTVSEARYQGTILTAAHAHWQKISLMKRFPYTLQCDFDCHDGLVKRIMGRNPLERRSGPSWIWGKSSHFAPWKCHPPL